MNMNHDMQDSISTATSSSSTVFIVQHPVVAVDNDDQERTPNSSGWSRPSPSRPASPVSDTPPDSPSLTDPGSVSSLPSVSSSFFFSSAAATPPPPPHSLESLPHVQGHGAHMDALFHLDEDHHHDSDPPGHLIIPSLSLPAALRRPTAYGQALGDVRVLVLKLSDAPHPKYDPREPSQQPYSGTSESDAALDIGRLLVGNNEDIVDIGTWEPFHPPQPRHDGSIDAGMASWRSLRASTDWIEHHDAHGLEKYEPSRNIEIVEITLHLPPTATLAPLDSEYQTYDRLIRPALTTTLTDVQTFLTYPFRELTTILHPSLPPFASSLVHTLLAASGSPLCAGLLLVYDLYNVAGHEGAPGSPQMGRRRTARQAFDTRIVVAEHIITESLSPYVPIIKLPSSASASMLYPTASQTSLSTRTRDPTHTHHFPSHYLQPGSILRSSTLPCLRREAAERFLRWYEIDRIVGHFGVPNPRKLITQASDASHAPNSPKGKKLDIVAGGTIRPHKSNKRKHDEATFEQRKAQWESELSIQVARRRPGSAVSSERRLASDTAARPFAHWEIPSFNSFDPLHFPSILWLSCSLIGPFSRRIGSTILRPFSTAPPTSSERDHLVGHSTEVTITEDKSALAPTPAPVPQRKTYRPSVLSRLKTRSWVVIGIVGVGVGFVVGASIGFTYHAASLSSV